MMLPQYNAWSLVKLRVRCSLHALTRLPSGFRPNLYSSMNITLPQSDIIQCTCWRYHCNPGPLDWTDKGSTIYITHDTQGNRSFMCSLRRIVVADIGIPMAAAILNVKMGWSRSSIQLGYNTYIDLPEGRKPSKTTNRRKLQAFGQIFDWFGTLSIIVKWRNDELRRSKQQLW